MPRIYRAMTRDGEFPMIGATRRCLGVITRDEATGPKADIPVSDGYVWPETGGMSVAPSWRGLPPYRIPQRLNGLVAGAMGNNKDACWRMGEGPFEAGAVSEGLSLRPDKPGHGLVEPATTMRVQEYERHIASTRESWIIDEV